MRIGYLVPEFPSQTHNFFWRELAALRKEGVEADLISTRRPPPSMVSPAWTSEAERKTLYLKDELLASVPLVLRELLRVGPAGLVRCTRAIWLSSDSSRYRLCGLALVGAKLSAVARRRGWKHVHVHSCGDAANVASFAAMLSGLHYSITLHGALADYGGNQCQKWKFAQFAIVITRKLRAEVQTALSGFLPRRIDIAPMGVDLDTFHRTGHYRPWASHDTLAIFTCGRLNRTKGHADLITAIAILRRHGIDAELTIAGEEDAVSSGYRRELQVWIEELKLGSSVHLLGAVPEYQVVLSLEGAHIFALLSFAEPLGVAIMEAMAMEVPVVATRAGGVSELIDDQIDGLLVEPHNPEKAAEAIERLARDGGLATQIGARGRQKIAKEFHSSRSAEVLTAALLSSDKMTPEVRS